MNTPRVLLCLLLTAGTTRAQAQDNPAPATEPALTEMQKWIATTDAQWQAAFNRDVVDVHAAELKKLAGQYGVSLDAALAKASAAGDLDGALALRNEQKRFTETNVFPEQDDAADAASVKQIRAATRVQLAKIEQENAARTKALHAKYDAVLAQAQMRLTQAKRIDDALLLKAKRDEVGAAWLTGIPAAPAPVAVAEQPKPQVPVPVPKVVAAPATETASGNLFQNPNFENGMEGWKLTTWGKKGSMEIDPKELHNGKPSLRIINTDTDHTLVNQKVPVKPHTRYRLSGYIKTKDVEPAKRGQKEGAELMVTGGWERTPPVSQTKGWARFTHEFTNGSGTEIVVGMSLGHYSAPAKGTAWFSELSLIELGPNAKK